MIGYSINVEFGVTSVYGIDRRGDWHLIARSDVPNFPTTFSGEEIAQEFCAHLNRLDIGMVNCGYGCKIYRCEVCGFVEPMHNSTYGCRQLS